ncbi:MAG TPA: FAD-binding protein, partial [Desulfatiglandales bacterium]
MEKQMLINKLKDIVGSDYVLNSKMDLTLYGYDASLEKGKPDVVVLPNSTEEVSKVVRLAYEAMVPIIGRGSGTNL